MPFTALEDSDLCLPLLAVDIGYSSTGRSCGIAFEPPNSPRNVFFGERWTLSRRLFMGPEMRSWSLGPRSAHATCQIATPTSVVTSSA
jgi:hypothetical protein